MKSIAEVWTSPWFLVSSQDRVVKDGKLIIHHQHLISLSPKPDDAESRLALLVNPALGQHIVSAHNDAIAKPAEAKDAVAIHTSDLDLAAELERRKIMREPKMLKTTIRMEPDLTAFLSHLAEKHDVSMSKLVRLAIEKAYNSQLTQYKVDLKNTTDAPQFTLPPSDVPAALA